MHPAGGAADRVSLFFNDPVAVREGSRLSYPPAAIQPSRGLRRAVADDAAMPPGARPRWPVHRSLHGDIVTGVGAGIYEELVFRLILICALMVLFQDVVGIDHKNAVILSVLISAALFSAHHHHITFIDGHFERGAPFRWTEFVFRTAAGVYFAFVRHPRLGIAAGTHAHDIIATIINAIFSTRNLRDSRDFARQRKFSVALTHWHS
jgi:hypothetical protein